MVSQEDIDAFVGGRTLDPNVEREIAEGLQSPESVIARQVEACVQAFHRILDGGPGDDQTQKAALNLQVRASFILERDGNLSAALLARNAAYQRAVDTLGPLDRDTLSYLSGVGMLHYAMDNFEGACEVFERLVKLCGQAGVLEDVACGFTKLGRVYEKLGNYPVALVCHTRAVDMWEIAPGFGPDHLDTGISVHRLGQALMQVGDFAKAIQCLERALKIYRDFGEDTEGLLADLWEAEYS